MPQGYLWECLDSLGRQTLPREDYEVIVVQNGPHHPYEEQIEQYIDAHPETKWRFVSTVTRGVSNARNLGLKAACGEYVTFVDDDDMLSPTCLEGLLSVSSPQCVGLCHPQAFTDDPAERAPYVLEDDWLRLRSTGAGSVPVDFTLAARQFCGSCMKLIHRDIIAGRRFDVYFRNGEDSLFMFLISDRFSTVRLTPPDAVYHRRYREGSANNSLTPRRRIHNSYRMVKAYLRIYLRNRRAYRRDFFLTRLLGACKTMLVG